MHAAISYSQLICAGIFYCVHYCFSFEVRYKGTTYNMEREGLHLYRSDTIRVINRPSMFLNIQNVIAVYRLYSTLS